jgi:hypothetical protein
MFSTRRVGDRQDAHWRARSRVLTLIKQNFTQIRPVYHSQTTQLIALCRRIVYPQAVNRSWPGTQDTWAHIERCDLLIILSLDYSNHPIHAKGFAKGGSGH